MKDTLRLIKLYYRKRILLRMRTVLSYIISALVLAIVITHTLYNFNIIKTSTIILVILFIINLVLKLIIKTLENSIKELRFNYDKKR